MITSLTHGAGVSPRTNDADRGGASRAPSHVVFIPRPLRGGRAFGASILTGGRCPHFGQPSISCFVTCSTSSTHNESDAIDEAESPIGAWAHDHLEETGRARRWRTSGPMPRLGAGTPKPLQGLHLCLEAGRAGTAVAGSALRAS